MTYTFLRQPSLPLTYVRKRIIEDLTLNRIRLTPPLADMNFRHLAQDLARSLLHMSALFPLVNYVRNFVRLLHWIRKDLSAILLFGQYLLAMLLGVLPTIACVSYNSKLRLPTQTFLSIPSRYTENHRSVLLAKFVEQNREGRMILFGDLDFRVEP